MRASNWGRDPYNEYRTAYQFIVTMANAGPGHAAIFDKVRCVKSDTATGAYKVLPISANGPYLAESPYTFLDIQRDHTIEFQFSPDTSDGEEEEPDPYAISSATMDGGTVGVAYADTVSYTSPVSADVRIHIRGIPPGLVLKRDGTLTGTPLTAGTYTPTVQLNARNARVRQITKQLSITIGAE